MDLSSLVVGVIGLVALVTKMTDFLRLLTNLPNTRSSVVTQVCAFVAGVAGVFLYSASQFGATVQVASTPLNDLDSASKIILGLALASAGSLAIDFKQAIDNSDSSAKPALLEPPPDGG